MPTTNATLDSRQIELIQAQEKADEAAFMEANRPENILHRVDTRVSQKWDLLTAIARVEPTQTVENLHLIEIHDDLTALSRQLAIAVSIPDYPVVDTLPVKEAVQAFAAIRNYLTTILNCWVSRLFYVRLNHECDRFGEAKRIDDANGLDTGDPCEVDKVFAELYPRDRLATAQWLFRKTLAQTARPELGHSYAPIVREAWNAHEAVIEAVRAGNVGDSVGFNERYLSALNALRDCQLAFSAALPADGQPMTGIALGDTTADDGKKRKTGRPSVATIDPDEAADRKRAADAWDTKRYRTYAECARELGTMADGSPYTKRIVGLAVGSRRKRKG